jgi:hypothetical protein
MQGDIDRCVFSSLASAFNHTGIPDLVRVAPVCPRSPKNASSLAWPFVVQDNDGKQVRQSRSHFVFEEGTRNKKVVKKRYSIKISAIQHITIFRGQTGFFNNSM